MFTKSSLGYRPHNSAHQASKSCQQNGWKDEWVVALDIKSSFDTIDHQWMMRMPEVGTKQKWVLMYVPRWRQAPMQRPGGGQLKQRTKGTPQGGVISPLLANIYLHYGLDSWLENKHRDAAFERYADDVIIHCHSKERAQRVLAAIKERVAKFGLQVSGEKTKIVYGKRGNRPEKKEEIQKFTFLGQDVKPKTAKNSRTGKKFLSFVATASKAARIKMNQTLKAYNNKKSIRKAPI